MRLEELAQKMALGEAPPVIDVRTGYEFRKGHIPGALHVPTWKIVLGLADLPPDRETAMVVLCELGPRASIAAALLRRLFGYRNISLLEGHMTGWRRSGLPMDK